MNIKQAKNLSLIFRQMCGVVKRSIDEVADLAESALMIVADESLQTKALPSSNDENQLLNRKELATRLDVKVRIIGKLINEGLPTVPVGRLKKFRYDKVLAWLENRKIPKRRKTNLRVVK